MDISFQPEIKEPKTESSKNTHVGIAWRSTFQDDQQFVESILHEPALLAKAIESGYDRKEIDQGIELAQDVMIADSVWTVKQAEKTDQYSLYHQSLKNLWKEYVQHIKKARKIFNKDSDKGIIQKLKLKGRRPTNNSSKIDIITDFYKHCLNDNEIIQRLKQRNITQEIIQRMLSLTEEVLSNKMHAKNRSIMAKKATTERNKKKNLFYTWFKEFKIIFDTTPDPQTPLQNQSKPKTVKAKG